MNECVGVGGVISSGIMCFMVPLDLGLESPSNCFEGVFASRGLLTARTPGKNWCYPNSGFIGFPSLGPLGTPAHLEGRHRVLAGVIFPMNS